MTYRFTLRRQWSNALRMAFVMLNPSTADEHDDDPTIRRCCAFAKREGAGGIVVGNLSPWRATDPKALYAAHAAGLPVLPPENRDVLRRIWCEAPMVVLAWGGGIRPWLQPEAAFVRSLGVGARCLGRTASGEPRHPLMLRADAALELA